MSHTFLDTTFHTQGIHITEGGLSLGPPVDKNWVIEVGEITTHDGEKIAVHGGEGENVSCLQIGYGGEIYAKILASKSGITPNFIGRYRCFMTEACDMSNFVGMIVSSTGHYYNLDMSQTPRAENAIPTITLTHKEEDPAVLGVISGLENYSRECNFGIFHTVLEQEDGINRMIVNCLGLGVVWVCDKNGPLFIGDYIVSSGIPGYGKKQSDDILRNATVAKVTQTCIFKPSVITLTTPVEFTEDGPVYEPLRNLQGDIITDCDYVVRYIDSRGHFISIKRFEESMEQLIIELNEFQYPYEQRRQRAFCSTKRSVFRAALIGCTYCC